MTSKVDFTARLHELVQEDKQKMTRWVHVDNRLYQILYIQDGELSPLGDQTEKIKKLASLIITAHGRDFDYIDSQGAHFADKIQSHATSIQQTPLIKKENPTAQDAWNLLEEIATTQSEDWVDDVGDGLVILQEEENDETDLIMSGTLTPISSVSHESFSSGYDTACSSLPATPRSPKVEFFSDVSRPATPTSPKMEIFFDVSRAATPRSSNVVTFPGKNRRYLVLKEQTKNAQPWRTPNDNEETSRSILAELKNESCDLSKIQQSKIHQLIVKLESHRDFRPTQKLYRLFVSYLENDAGL